jgi:D-xylose transport system substrate-binding protein
MAQLKALAAKGKGLIGVLLPDTTTSARYESYERPYLKEALKDAGLSNSQFKDAKAQGSTMRPRPTPTSPTARACC